MLYFELLISFFKIGLLTYGGGYSALPLINETAVLEKGWLTSSEMTDMISLSEISPGPFSLNCSTFVGMKMAGWPGAVITTTGFLLPTAIIVLVLALTFRHFRESKGARRVLSVLSACIVAVLLNSAISLFRNSVLGNAFQIDWIALLIFAAAFILLIRRKVNPIYMMLVSGALGLILYSLVPAYAACF